MFSLIREALSLLNKKEKGKIKIISSLIIFGSFLEVLCMYIFYLSIKFFTNQKNFISTEENFFKIYNFFGLENNQLLVSLVVMLLIAYLIKFLYFSRLYYVQFRFINDLMISFSSKLLSKYIYSNYEFHSSEDNSKLIRNVKDETGIFCHGLVTQIITFSTEIAVFIGISILIILAETKKFVIIFSIIVLISFLYFILLKPYYSKYGLQRQKFTNSMINYVMNSLLAIKDIKILQVENFFLDKFRKSTEKLGNANTIVTTLNQIPRLGLELISIIIIAIFIFIQFNENYFDTEILASVGLLIAAAFKLIPSISRIINSLNGIKFASPTVNVLKFQFENNLIFTTKNLSKTAKEKNIFNKSIKLSELSFKYLSRDRDVFNNLNLEIKKNTKIGIMGESGSGKSTLIDIITGLYKPTKGEVLIDGKNLETIKEDWLSIIGYVPQKVFIINESLKQNIALGTNEEDIDEKKIESIINYCSLDKLINNLPEGTKTKLGDGGASISGGEAQRIGIARALYKNCELIILDEFTTSLDVDNETKLLNMVKEISKLKTIIIIAHKKEILNFCDEIYFVKNKEISKIK